MKLINVLNARRVIASKSQAKGVNFRTSFKFMKFIKSTDEDEKFYKAIKNENVLIVDDVSTTMSTLQYVVNTLRLINDENELTLFCLLGNKK